MNFRRAEARALYHAKLREELIQQLVADGIAQIEQYLKEVVAR